MKRKAHAIAGLLTFCLIASFWTSTLVAELFLSSDAVVRVKVAITYGLLLLVPCMAVTGASGFAMGRKSSNPMLIAKRKRMPVIAATGLLVLMPAAIYLSGKAQAGEFDFWFYSVQGLELLAGASNLLLIGRNIRAGQQLRG